MVAVDSPGAPGAEALLLRSGRISEEDWTAAVREGAHTRSHRAELVERGNVGSAELQLVGIMAAQDGAFAVAVGNVEECVLDHGTAFDVLLPVVHGIGSEDLLRETARRLDALASLPFPVSPYQDRVVPAPGVDLSTLDLTPARREILTQATGRRSARDIAFMVGRSLYPVAVEISRMLTDGLLEIAKNAQPVNQSGITALTPRRPGGCPEPEVDPNLPRREPGTSGAPQKGSGRQMLSRLFNRTERKHIGP